MDGESRSPLFYRHVAAGAVSAVVASALTYPLDVAKTVAQAGVAQASVAHAVVAQTGAVQGSTIAGGPGGGSSGGLARSGTAAASRAAATSGLNWRSRAAFTGFSPHIAGHLPSLAARYTTYHLAAAYQMDGLPSWLPISPLQAAAAAGAIAGATESLLYVLHLKLCYGLPSWMPISPPQAALAGAIAGATESLLSTPFDLLRTRLLLATPLLPPVPPSHPISLPSPSIRIHRPSTPSQPTSSSLGKPSPSEISPNHTSSGQSATINQSSNPTARAGVRAEGAAQLWRGLRAGVTRDSLFGAVFFGGWVTIEEGLRELEELQRRKSERDGEEEQERTEGGGVGGGDMGRGSVGNGYWYALTQGLEAAVAAAVASVVSHPFDCAKTRTQATVLPKVLAKRVAMEALEKVVTQAQGLSGSASDLAHLLEVLRGAEDALAKHAPQLDTLLASLDPALHSLAFLFFLDAHAAQAPGALWEQVVGTIINFIKVASPTQLALAPEKFATLCHRLRDQLISHSQYARGVLPLRWAISKVQQCTTAEHLTPQHADCLQLCLLAKLYRQGGDLLQGDILDIDPKKTGLVHRDFLLYCFYGGTIYVGLKQYQKALDLFMHAITSPAQVVNAITVSAYKRHVLVSLILNAQLSPLPKFTPGIVQRGLKACCQDYHDLANIYVSRDAAELKKFVDSHEQAFKADNNLGLAHQVVASVPKRSIQRLTHTYLTLSLSDLAQSVHLSSPAEAEKYLLSMIADGEMFARIDQQAGMVSFEEDPEKYDSLAMAAVVEEHIQRAMKTSKKLAFLREHVSSN
ncbi:unnamed protein product [Closterium sp. NIES-64]|nr:unnamed protein product [Closterium sp. NIES-64]